MRGKFKKFVVYLLATAIIMPLWLISGLLNAKPAMAATSVTGGGTVGAAVINGTGLFTLKPLVVISQSDGDISAIDDIQIRINDSTTAQLQFNSGGGVSAVATVTDPTDTFAVGLPIESSILIDIPVTNFSVAGDVIVVSGIKIKAASTGIADTYLGSAQLQVTVDNDMTVFGFGDLINVDAQLPTITSVETQDLNVNGQIDAVKVTFSENIKDSTVNASDFNLAGGYVPQLFNSNTNGDVADNNYIYLTFTEIGTPDTFTTPDLIYTAGNLADLAGNLLANVTKTSLNNTALAAPANLIVTVGDGEVSLTWDAVVGADHYNIYYQKFSDSEYVGPISTTFTSAIITGLQNGANYRFIVRAVGTNAIESANAWLEATPNAPRVVLAPAPAPITVAPKSAEAAPSAVEQPAATEEPVEEGEIKGEESTTEEEADENINWTPWIILFVLIILAGAATGGYFYWFAGDEEIQTVVKSKPETDKKSATATKTKGSAKKPRRW